MGYIHIFKEKNPANQEYYTRQSYSEMKEKHDFPEEQQQPKELREFSTTICKILKK